MPESSHLSGEFDSSTPISRSPSGDCGFFNATLAGFKLLLELRDSQAVRWVLVERDGSDAASFLEFSSEGADVMADALAHIKTTLALTYNGQPVGWRGLAVQALPIPLGVHARLEVPCLSELRLEATQPELKLSLRGIIGVQDLVFSGLLCSDSLRLWQAYWACQPDSFR